MVLKWLLPTALIVVAINLPMTLLRFRTYSQVRAPPPELSNSFYFYNEITGEVQWQDPGNTPFEDEHGARYWLDSNNERMAFNPEESQFVWIEQFSEEAQRPFFYNQETRQSTWDRPQDLGWRRIKAH